MALLVTVRKAVQGHVCDTCGLDIAAGKRYLRLFYTRDEAVGAALSTAKECGSCAIYSGRSARLKAAIGAKIRRRAAKSAGSAPSSPPAAAAVTVVVPAAAAVAPLRRAALLSVAQAARERAFGQSV